MNSNEVAVKDGAILRDYDVSRLKKLVGNRSVDDIRLNKIKRSVEKIGWIKPLIIVNEKNEVIDGQGRVEIAKQYNLPIDVKVIKGLTIDDCMAMNIDQTNWKLMDFIKSYSQQGNDNYKRIESLIKHYKNSSITTIAYTFQDTKWDTRMVKEGKAKCSLEQYEKAVDMLDWLDEYDDYLTGKVGGSEAYKIALLFIRKHTDADLIRLKQCVQNHKWQTNETAGNIEQALDILTELYNYRLGKGNKIYFNHEYMEMLSNTPSSIGGYRRWHKK